MPRPGLSLSHIGLFVHDMARMEDFYTRVLEFFVTDRGQLPGPNGPMDLVFTSRDPDEHHQIVLISGRPDAQGFNIVNQLSLRADSLTTLRDMHRRLHAEGCRNITPVTHGNALSVYALDPEGTRLELFIDLPWYVDQPMRVPVDFALDDDALMAHVEQHARQLPGFRPRAQWRAEMAKMMGLD
jgi:catechol 2,3-dioxygenase-like lactoylglutathione lyase family enzyme